MSVVVIKRSFVYLPAALAIISDKEVDGDEDDHKVGEVQTCKCRCCGRMLMAMKMIMRKMRCMKYKKCILASGAVVAEVLHVCSAPVSPDSLKYHSSSTSSSSLLN